MLREIQILVKSVDEHVLRAIRETTDDDGICWESQSDIAERASCCRATVNRSVRRLAAARHIEIKGSRNRQIYRLITKQ